MIALRLGTRGSPLALWQAKWVSAQLRKRYTNITIELVTITSTGDELPDIPLPALGNKGLFTDRIEERLLDGSIDIAVHSLKDLPTVLPEGLEVAAYTQREDARDVLISTSGASLAELPSHARVGTSSLRRRAQLLGHRPDVVCVDLRGNVHTRIKKLERSSDMAAIVMAAAGIIRAGLSDVITEYLDEDTFLPAPGQGVIAVEIASERDDMRSLLQSINHRPSEYEALAERIFLQELEGGCQVPIAARAVYATDGRLDLRGMVSCVDGTQQVKVQVSGCDPVLVGTEAAALALEKGAAGILEETLSLRGGGG